MKTPARRKPRGSLGETLTNQTVSEFYRGLVFVQESEHVPDLRFL
jgi:hypothetical protein